MMRSSRWLAVLLLLSMSPSWAQSPSSGKSFDHLPASDRQLISVKVAGTKRYADDAVLAASGLQLGTTVTEDDFKKAARRLGDLGVFSDIAYSYSYSSAGTKLALQVTDVDKFVPVRFEDFVWFSDHELLQRIRIGIAEGRAEPRVHMVSAIETIVHLVLVRAVHRGLDAARMDGHPVALGLIAEAVAAGQPDPTRDPELVAVIGSMPMSTLAGFSGMSIDHDTLDELVGRWRERPQSR